MLLALLLLAAPPSGRPPASDQLIGTWRPLDGDEPEKRLVTYKKDGTGTAVGSTFRWKLDGAQLTVTYDDGSELLARIEFQRGELVETDLVDTDVRRYRRVKTK